MAGNAVSRRRNPSPTPEQEGASARNTASVSALGCNFSLTPEQEDAPLYSPDTWTLDESLGYLLAQVRGKLVAAIDAELAELGITWAQWSILLKIASGKGDTASNLCSSGCDTGSMTRMLDRLEQKGLVRRERSQEDRRVVLLQLTEAGKALYPQLPPIAVKVLNHHLRGFRRDELDTFKSYLRRMLANDEVG